MTIAWITSNNNKCNLRYCFYTNNCLERIVWKPFVTFLRNFFRFGCLRTTTERQERVHFNVVKSRILTARNEIRFIVEEYCKLNCMAKPGILFFFFLEVKRPQNSSLPSSAFSWLITILDSSTLRFLSGELYTCYQSSDFWRRSVESKFLCTK